MMVRRRFAVSSVCNRSFACSVHSGCAMHAADSPVETALGKRQLKRVEWASVTVALLDAQRFGEWDAPHPRPEPDVTLLPQKKLKNYLKTPTSKPLSSIVPSEHNKEEFMKKVNAAFVEAGLVDRVAFFYAPKILGGRDARTGVAGEGLPLAAGLPLEKIRWRNLGPDLMLTARVARA